MPGTLIETLNKILKPLYKQETNRIIQSILDYQSQIKKVELNRPDLGWYNYIDIYAMYADSIQIDRRKSAFENVYKQLDRIQMLGCNAVHLLPFLDSPLKDAGFDIANFYQPRKDLGSLDQLQKVVKRARELNIRVFMDLVFNHVSENHIWFQKAQTEEKYRNFFLYSKTKPKCIRTYEKNSAVWADYEVEGKTLAVNVAFPDHMTDPPHFIQGQDGYWYYHTYYPEEIDLNWLNPEMFIEMAKVLMYWASRGFNFRIDAAPFIGKGIYKDANSTNENTHIIIAALRCIATDINPETVMLIESYEEIKSIIQYFGTSNHVEANLAYNFFLNTATWVSLVKQDATPIWQKMDKIDETPKHAEWLNFLRNHDELSLAYLSPNIVKEMKQALLPNGELFRSDYGISGRTFAFLGNNVRRFLMAYFLVMSFPGGLMIPFGDEIGMKNIPLESLNPKLKNDTRNINRGKITKKDYSTAKAKKIFAVMSGLFKKRQELRSYLNVWPERISSQKEIFATSYKQGSSELKVFINLSNKKRVIHTNSQDYLKLSGINRAKVNLDTIELGPYGGIWLQK